MSPLQVAIYALYYASLAILVIWALHRAYLARAIRGRLSAKNRCEVRHTAVALDAEVPAVDDSPRDAAPGFEVAADELPCVTIQLPMYNERYVAERAIRAACAIRYPSERLDIQVLDDSDDSTRGLVDAVVERLAADGLPVRVLRRASREGYKAGALDAGLSDAKGELIAIFDADFVPAEDYLERTVPHFHDARIAMVQAGWEHLNRESSFLTRAQALLLDGHFLVEQPGRFQRGHFFNFNGTAGIWRRDAIDDAGGWQHDTITEDLDLSYRAQLAGWHFMYLDGYLVPAELPADISAFRSQQHRWAKGSTECLRKLWPRLLNGRGPRRQRIHGWMHLSANLNYLATLAVAILMPLVATSREAMSATLWAFVDVPLLLLGFGAVGYFYRSALARRGHRFLRALPALLFALAVDIGMSVVKARGVIEAMLGHRSAFVRTPKHALVGRSAFPEAAAYLRGGLAAGGVELVIALWLLWGIVAVSDDETTSWLSLPFLMLFFVGFGFVGSLCFARSFQLRMARLEKRVQAS